LPDGSLEIAERTADASAVPVAEDCVVGNFRGCGGEVLDRQVGVLCRGRLVHQLGQRSVDSAPRIPPPTQADLKTQGKPATSTAETRPGSLELLPATPSVDMAASLLRPT
jgi:hypothetical protein